LIELKNAVGVPFVKDTHSLGYRIIEQECVLALYYATVKRTLLVAVYSKSSVRERRRKGSCFEASAQWQRLKNGKRNNGENNGRKKIEIN